MSADKPIPDATRLLAELVIDQCEGCGCDECLDNVDRIIARAIMAAEDRQREKDARLVAGIGEEISKQSGNFAEDQIGKSIASLASAIRNGG